MILSIQVWGCYTDAKGQSASRSRREVSKQGRQLRQTRSESHMSTQKGLWSNITHSLSLCSTVHCESVYSREVWGIEPDVEI